MMVLLVLVDMPPPDDSLLSFCVAALVAVGSEVETDSDTDVFVTPPTTSVRVNRTVVSLLVVGAVVVSFVTLSSLEALGWADWLVTVGAEEDVRVSLDCEGVGVGVFDGVFEGVLEGVGVAETVGVGVGVALPVPNGTEMVVLAREVVGVSEPSCRRRTLLTCSPNQCACAKEERVRATRRVV